MCPNTKHGAYGFGAEIFVLPTVSCTSVQRGRKTEIEPKTIITEKFAEFQPLDNTQIAAGMQGLLCQIPFCSVMPKYEARCVRTWTEHYLLIIVFHSPCILQYPYAAIGMSPSTRRKLAVGSSPGIRSLRCSPNFVTR